MADRLSSAMRRRLFGSNENRIVAVILTCLAVGALLVTCHVGRSFWAAALLWSGAWAGAGGVVGFVFGVPATRNKLSPRVNSNLEEVADWLTKILVGLALTQIASLPDALVRAATVVSEVIGGDHQRAFALAMILYFSVAGFLGSYLLTRTSLAQGFFDWKDEEGGQATARPEQGPPDRP